MKINRYHKNAVKIYKYAIYLAKIIAYYCTRSSSEIYRFLNRCISKFRFLLIILTKYANREVPITAPLPRPCIVPRVHPHLIPKNKLMSDKEKGRHMQFIKKKRITFTWPPATKLPAGADLLWPTALAGTVAGITTTWLFEISGYVTKINRATYVFQHFRQPHRSFVCYKT